MSNNLGFQLSGLLYPNTRYPPIIQHFPRFFGQEIWPLAMRSSSFSMLTPGQSVDSFEEREIQRLSKRVKELERELDHKQRLFRFTTRVSKKLVCIGQMSTDEMMDAVDLGIGIDFSDAFWTPSTRDVSTSYDEHKLTDSFSAQFPDPDDDENFHSTVVLHKGGETQISEMSIGALKSEDSLTGVITHGVEPKIDDIMFFYDNECDLGIKSDPTLKDCLKRLNRVDQTNKKTDAKFKVTMKEALEIEKLASNLVQRIMETRNSNSKMNAAISKIEVPLPSTSSKTNAAISKIEIPLPSTSASTSKQNMIKNVPDEIPQPISAVCVRGDAGRNISGIPVRIIPQRIKPKHVTFAKNPVAGPSRRAANEPRIPVHGALKIKARAPLKRFDMATTTRASRPTAVTTSRPADRTSNNGGTNTMTTTAAVTVAGPSSQAVRHPSRPSSERGNPESNSNATTVASVGIPEDDEDPNSPANN